MINAFEDVQKLNQSNVDSAMKFGVTGAATGKRSPPKWANISGGRWKTALRRSRS